VEPGAPAHRRKRAAQISGSAARSCRRKQRERLRSLRERESQIATRFAENVLDSTGAFSLVLDDAQQLAGIPEDVLEQYREAAGADGRTGYKLTLHAPSYLPALQYAQDRSLRERLYRAYTTRASEFGPAEWDNTPLMLELLKLRREHAQLLGYRNFAELSLVPKMAQSVDDVAQFLRDLARRARPHAQREIADLGRVRRRPARIDGTEAVGHLVRGRAPPAGPLRLFGAGAEAVFPAVARARWPVRADRAPVLGPDPLRSGSGVAPRTCAFTGSRRSVAS